MVQIIELLGNKSVVKIVSFFLRNPTLQIHQQDLRKKIKMAKATSIKWLDFLVRQNILNLVIFGRSKVYSLNRESSIVQHIKMIDTLLLISPIKGLTQGVDIKIYLYGSAARGEDVESSDIDLLIIGKIRKEDIVRGINRLAENIHRDIKIEIFSPQEWSVMAKKDPAFYERVEKDKKEL